MSAAPDPPDGGALHQISMSFVPEEDRVQLILIGAEGEDSRFWLSRRFVRGLWGVLRKSLETFPDLRRVIDADTRRAMLAMRREDALRHSDFATPRRETDEPPRHRVPLLVAASVRGAEHGRLSLALKTRGGHQVAMTLDERRLHAFCHLLVETALAADWDLDLAVGDGDLAAPRPGRRLH